MTPITCNNHRIHEVKEMNTIHVTQTCESLEKLNRSLFGEVRSYHILKNLQEFSAVEGLNDAKVCYYGGLSVLIEFRTRTAAKDYLILTRSSWSNWFRSLDSWSPEVKNMKHMGALWGEVVVPEKCSDDSFIRSMGKVVILTQEPKVINEEVEMVVNGNSYKIMAIEDFNESVNLGPRLLKQMKDQEEEEEVGKMADNDDSLFDENSNFFFDGDDDMGFEANDDDNLEDEDAGEEKSLGRDSPVANACKTTSLPVHEAPEKALRMKNGVVSHINDYGHQMHKSTETPRAWSGSPVQSLDRITKLISSTNFGPSPTLPSSPTPKLTPNSDEPILEPQNSNLLPDFLLSALQSSQFQLQDSIEFSEDKENTIDMDQEIIDASTLFWEKKPTN
ncbi:hypothetical protein LXL04_010203 [Taraxacum kok-saghyz]